MPAKHVHSLDCVDLRGSLICGIDSRKSLASTAIAEEHHAGYPHKQAIAIGLSRARAAVGAKRCLFGTRGHKCVRDRDHGGPHRFARKQ